MSVATKYSFFLANVLLTFILYGTKVRDVFMCHPVYADVVQWKRQVLNATDAVDGQRVLAKTKSSSGGGSSSNSGGFC